MAKFLGTPPINVFEGKVRGGVLTVGADAVMELEDTPDRDVWVGIRPEGFIPDAGGSLRCGLVGVGVMGRDTTVVATHPACAADNLRAIISEETDYRADGSVHWTITDIRLYEVSVCTFPAYEETQIVARSAEAEAHKKRELDAWKLRQKERLSNA